MSVVFSDSIDNNVEILRELMRGLPPETQRQAKLAASKIEQAVLAIQKDGENSAGAALGTAFAIYLFAERFVQTSQDGGGEGEKLIQLLN